MNWYRGDGYGWMDGSGMLFMGIMWILILGLGIWLVTWLTRRDRSLSAPKAESPRQILDRRLAAGEIDSATYTQARGLIEGKIPGQDD
jgi:putative membrane protein